MAFSPSPCSVVDYGNTVKLLVVSLTVLWGPVCLSPVGVFNCQSCLPWDPVVGQLQFTFSYPGTASWTLSLLQEAAISCICLSVCPVSRAAECPVSPLFRVLEELLIFQPVQLFTCCYNGVITFKLTVCFLLYLVIIYRKTIEFHCWLVYDNLDN